MSTEFFGKTLSGPFTIPSGIVSTAVPIIQYVFDHMPEVGVLTTKSIGLEPRAGYREPILSQYAPGCFVNAVGLTNPGAHKSAELMAQLRVPEDRFLLTSIFGGSIAEFVEVAKIMAPVSDGLELNLSCPHAKGYGMAMGQDPDMVREIVSAVKAVVDIPVIPKLTPNTPDISDHRPRCRGRRRRRFLCGQHGRARVYLRPWPTGAEQRRRRDVRQGHTAHRPEVCEGSARSQQPAHHRLRRRLQRR